jgi:hypothetical protein
MSEWCEYWTPEEYADMRRCLRPEQLQEELCRMRAKSEHGRVAEAFGISAEEALLMRLRARVFAEGAA